MIQYFNYVLFLTSYHFKKLHPLNIIKGSAAYSLAHTCPRQSNVKPRKHAKEILIVGSLLINSKVWRLAWMSVECQQWKNQKHADIINVGKMSIKSNHVLKAWADRLHACIYFSCCGRSSVKSWLHNHVLDEMIDACGGTNYASHY